MDFLQHSTGSVCSLPYDFPNNIFFPSAYFIIRVHYTIHITYKICAYQLFMLLIAGPTILVKYIQHSKCLTGILCVDSSRYYRYFGNWDKKCRAPMGRLVCRNVIRATVGTMEKPMEGVKGYVLRILWFWDADLKESGASHLVMCKALNQAFICLFACFVHYHIQSSLQWASFSHPRFTHKEKTEYCTRKAWGVWIQGDTSLSHNSAICQACGAVKVTSPFKATHFMSHVAIILPIPQSSGRIQDVCIGP